MDGVLAMRPGQCIFNLDRGVVEDLYAVRAADGLVAEVHQRENVSRNTGQTELLIRIAARCIGVLLVVGREDLTTKTDLVDQRRREGAIPVDHEVLERIL